ncbi:MAG TPA: MFS transporter, partial [Acidimicrobiales bacterium]|nr:MFS transporter [Acidimicrobiales bacterium]
SQVGRLGDMYGRVRMYEAGFVVFVVGSALCALSWDQTSMVVFRLLQGLGGAFITANSGAVIADLFPPEERGKAYGYNSVGWSLGAVVGIVLGGVIVTYVSWRWIFWINVPIGAVALSGALRVLHETAERRRHHIDLGGMVLLGLGMFGVLWAITELATTSLDGTLIGYLVGGAVLIVVFVLVESAQQEPMIDLSLFRIPTVTPSLVASLLQGLGNFATLFLVIMYLQGARQLTPIHASLLLVPGYVAGGAASPLAGRFADKLGPAWPATFGLAVQVIALAVYANLTIHTGLWVVVLATVVNGVGLAAFFPANYAAMMAASPRSHFGVASGMLRTFANIGMVFSFSMAILIASRSISKHVAFAIFVGSTSLHGRLAVAFTSGLHAAFYASMGLMGLAAACSAFRTRPRGAAPQGIEPVAAGRPALAGSTTQGGVS